MTFRDTGDAFRDAMAAGRLSDSRSSKLPYVDDYMYMGTDDTGRDLFKHIQTREYLPC